MKYLEDHYKVTGRKQAIDYSPNQGMAPDGYTTSAGAPTRYMVQIDGRKKWYRVMCWQFSNAATCFVRVGGVEYIVRFESTITGE